MWPVDLDDAGSVLVVEVLYPDVHPDPEVAFHIFPVPEAKIRLHSPLHVRLGEKDKRWLCTRIVREPESFVRRKIRLIEGNAKCRHLKNWSVKILCGRCLSVWGPGDHTLPPLHTASILIHTRKMGRGESRTREKARSATVHKAGSKILTWLTFYPV